MRFKLFMVVWLLAVATVHALTNHGDEVKKHLPHPEVAAAVAALEDAMTMPLTRGGGTDR